MKKRVGVKLYTCEIRGIDAKTMTVDHVISSLTVDRDSEVLAPRGMRFDNYQKNPVVFLNHRANDLPVGKNVGLQVGEKDVYAQTQFAGLDQLHALAETTFRLYRDGFMKSWSVGFRSITVSRDPLLPGQQGRSILEWELLEYSAVGIPANPEAVVRMAKAMGLPNGATDLDLMKAVGLIEPQKWWLVAEPITKTEKPQPEPEPTPEPQPEPEPVPEAAKAVSSNVSTTLAPEGEAWSAPALSDFTSTAWGDLGDAEKRKIAGHFAWAASMPPASFGDLKLPHHKAEGGAVVWRGVAAAMGRMGQAQIPEGDRRAVYNHLAAHYRAFEKTPPEMRAYSEQEWAAVEAFYEGREVPEDFLVNEVRRFDGETVVVCIPAMPKRSRVGGLKVFLGYQECGYTTPASGASSPMHVHDYYLHIETDGGEMSFEGGCACAVADHSHRITLESLMKGETEASDGHSHKLMGAQAMRDLVLSTVKASSGDVSLERMREEIERAAHSAVRVG